MSNKREFQQSIDTTVKLNSKLIEDLIDQFQSFDPLKTNNLLIKLKEILEFKNKKLKVNQSTNDVLNYIDSEITICDVKLILDSLCKLHRFDRLISPPNDLILEINEIREGIIRKLTLLPSELNTESNNESDYNETNYHESNYYESNNEPNYNESNNEPNYNESNNEPINIINESADKTTDRTTIKSTNNGQTINKLTNDDKIMKRIFSLIFSNLSIGDLFNCRLVNKQFKYFSDHTSGIYKLIIGPCSSDIYWYYNNKAIEDKDIISLECFRTIKLLSIFNLDKYLKYLKIYDEQFELEELSNLINLESLEFGYYYNKYNPQIINLNNLKVFASNNIIVKLNTPKLEKIKFYHIKRITFNSNLESIKHLITNNYDNKLEIFRNLEIIELGNTCYLNENLLIIFRYLKQLKIFTSSSYERIKNSLIKILNAKIKLKREIDIYLEGVKIKNIDKLNELKANQRPYWKFRLNNYDLLDSNFSSIYYLDYHQLEECVNNIENDLPSNFFDKFQYINKVYVSNVNDVNGLNWFLNNLKYLRTLVIESNVSLDEVFYNNLPNTIRYLTIYNQREDLNYDFILKLSKLIEFRTCVDKDLFDLAFTSISNLKYLKRFKFNFKRRHITIEKNGEIFYLNDIDKILDYNQLIVKCNKIRSK